MSGSGNKHRHQDFHRGFAKGGLLTASGTDTGTVLPVGADGTVLTADSAQANGIKWGTASASSSFGSNSNSVGSANAPGASSSNARADHVHQGVHQLTSNGSNGRFEDVNLAAGSGIALGVSGQTVTITNTGTSSGGSSGLTIEEADGSPTASATKLVLPNGTLSYVGTVATYTPTAGGGTGNLTAPSAVSVDLGASNLLTRQAATNTEDDLFDASPLNAKWLAYTGYNAVTDLTAKPGWCKITTDGAKLQAVPVGDWTVEAEVIPAPTTAAAFTTSGLVLTSGTTQSSATEARCSFGLNNSAGQTRVFFEKFVNGAFSSTYKQDSPSIGAVFPWIMRIVKSGTTYTVQFGNTREGLQFFFSTAALGFTPTHFGFHGAAGTYLNGFYRI